MTIRSTFEVAGMSCQHCVDAVTAEVGRLPGVEQVTIDLPTGHVNVSSTGELDVDAVRAAIDDAGYDLVAAGPAGSSGEP